jgi:endonuclease-3
MNWDAIFETLEAWRTTLKTQNEKDPAVSAVAETYRNDPWAVLASTVLSLRTKDDVTMRTSKSLLAKAPAPARLLAFSEEEVSRLIFPAGFYRTKARNLLAIARILCDKYNGVIPADMDALLALPGVGRKTANLVITEAFGLDGICVDVHVHRICNRAAWVETKTPEQTETALREILPRQFWRRINNLLVLYGQRLCRPVSPFCSKCLIKKYCAQKHIDKSR